MSPFSGPAKPRNRPRPPRLGRLLEKRPRSANGTTDAWSASNACPFRSPAAKEKRYQATIKKQAKAWKISPEEYQQFADEVHKEKMAHHTARESAKAAARKTMGISAADVRRWEEQGLDYSSSKLSKYQWDVQGQRLASQFPDLGWGEGYSEGVNEGGHDAKLWDLLKEGKVDPPSRHSDEFHADVDEYLQYLASQTPGGLDDPPDAEDTSFDFGALAEDDDDAIRFALDVVRLARQRRIFDDPGGAIRKQGRIDFDEEDHPRGPDGEFVKKDGGEEASGKKDQKPTKPTRKENEAQLRKLLGHFKERGGPGVRDAIKELSDEDVDRLLEASRNIGIEGDSVVESPPDRGQIQRWVGSELLGAQRERKNAKSRNESDQDKSYREWEENWHDVMGDPDKATDTNLIRARGFGSHWEDSLRRKGNHELADGVRSEVDNINRILREREQAKLQKVKTSSVDIPARGDLNEARKQKSATWSRVKDLRQQVKDAGPKAGQLRLDLLKAESAWHEAQRREKAALAAIEKRAQELGQTTRLSADSGPQEGDRKPAADGGTLVFHDGRWHRGGLGFASPHKEEPFSTVQEAFQAIGSERHKEMKQAFGEIDRAAGATASQIDIVGDWGKGAENSVLTEYTNYRDFDELRYLMAWKGKVAEQKATLVFEERESGPHHVYTLTLPVTIEEARQSLQDAGVSERSFLMPIDSGVVVVVVDRKGVFDEGTANVARKYRVPRTDAQGYAEQLGVEWDQPREQGISEFDRIIGEYEQRFPERPSFRPGGKGTRRMGLASVQRREANRPITLIGIGRRQGGRADA